MIESYNDKLRRERRQELREKKKLIAEINKFWKMFWVTLTVLFVVGFVGGVFVWELVKDVDATHLENCTSKRPSD